MHRRFVVVSLIAVVLTAVFLSGSGVGASAVAMRQAPTSPAGLAKALGARFDLGRLRRTDSPTEHPYFGGAVAMSADGTTALVSAEGAGNSKGAAYIYHVTDAGSWVSSSTPMATLGGTAYHGLGEDLGWGVALSADGTTAFVSAPFRFGAGVEIGAVLVFHVADESSWLSTTTPTAALTTPDGYFFGQGAMAASPDGTTLVIGDPDFNNYAGGAYVFHVADESSWVSTSTPTATLSNATQVKANESVAWTGAAISGDGSTVLLSDPGYANHAGGAYLFHAASESAWATSSTPTAILSNAGGATKDYLGGAVGLSGDGSTAFLGAWGVSSARGAIDVFHAADESSWATNSTPVAILTNSGAAAYDYLGDPLAVSADGATVATSAPGVLGKKGAAYVFHASAENAWASTSTPTAALSNPAAIHGDWRDEEVASSADGATLLLGSPLVNWSTGTVDLFHVADAGSWLTSSTPTATLTNSALPKPLCVVPNVLKYHVAFARQVLGEQNCRLGKVKFVHSTKKNRKRIVGQSPAPRKHLPPGSKVSVKVGK